MKEIEFLGCKIQYNENVLMPRQETEILAFYMLERIKGCKSGVVLDLCTGSGCLGLAIKKNRPDLHVILSDISPLAVACARKNAVLNELDVYCALSQVEDFSAPASSGFDLAASNLSVEQDSASRMAMPDQTAKRLHSKNSQFVTERSIEILEGDLLEPLGDRKVDYVICNPPYVSDEEYEHLDSSVRDYEPKIALVGGVEGLDFYARLSKELKNHLNPNGKVFFEIGKDQGAGVMRLFADWEHKEVLKDFAGHDRFFFLSV